MVNDKSIEQRRFFVTGTGTDVGKTMVTAGLVNLLSSLSLKVGVIKPVQTGVGEFTADLDTIKSLCPDLYKLPEEISSPYSFSLPASPHLAAAEEDVEIEFEKIITAIKKAENIPDLDVLLVEGAGGLMVPINARELMIDLISKLNYSVIIVASATLGTLNHTLLSINQLRSYNIDIAGVVINQMPVNPSIIEKDNVTTIEKYGKVKILGVITDLGEAINSPDAGELLGQEFEDKFKIEIA